MVLPGVRTCDILKKAWVLRVYQKDQRPVANASLSIPEKETKLMRRAYISVEALTQKMRLAGAWMTEKYFAATPFRCHNQYLEKQEIMLRAIENCIMAYGLIQLKLKDFEGIYAPAYQ